MPPGGGKPISLASYTWGGWDAFRPGQGIFSPSNPLLPAQPESVRLWDYPVGYNAIYTPRSYEATGFGELRALAESHDITRLAIETRKDQIERLDWIIKSRDGRRSGADIRPRIERLTEFWRTPDGEQPFASWLREALEDVLVLDAPAFEIRRNRGGDIIGLDVVDGSTIKVLIDDTGRRPRSPAPAYEQVICGQPWRLLRDDELIYLPRNRRPHKAYGFSPVEQIVATVNIGLRRQVMQLQHFTEGNVPPGLLSAPAGWSAEQIRQFQDWFELGPRGQYRQPHAPRLGTERRPVSAIQGGALQGRFRRMAGADRMLCLLAAAHRLHPAGQSRNRADRPRHGARRGLGSADGLGQTAGRQRDPEPHGSSRPRIRLVGHAVDRSQGSVRGTHQLCQRGHLHGE